MKIFIIVLMTLTLYGSDFSAMKASFDKGDIPRAISYTRTNAMKGNVPAMYNLGLLYYAQGKSKEARTWLERSVKNDGKGALGIAVILFAQAQNAKGYEKVMQALINAPKSKYSTALMSVSRDLAKKRDDASAQEYLLLAELYYYDRIVHPNLRITLYLTNQAARKGDAKAKEMMGDAYWRSNYTVDTLMVAPQTGNALNRALEYYRAASALGNLDATAKLGKLHIVGPRNLRRIDYGVQMILKSAEGGSAIGAQMAAELYVNGQGVQMNRKMALTWYKKATEICDVNRILADFYGSSDDGKVYKDAYQSCHAKQSSKRQYHILFEAF